MSAKCDAFIDAIALKKIYNFSSSQIKSIDNHYFIVVNIFDNSSVHLVCCTSQYEKRKKFNESRDLPGSTLVWISPDSGNKLNKDTYIDCNTLPVKYSIEDFRTMCLAELISYEGIISEYHYEQAIIGLRDSPMITESYKLTLPKIE